MAFSGEASLAVEAHKVPRLCALTLHPRDDRSLVACIREGGTQEVARILMGGAEPMMFPEDQPHTVCWPQAHFKFADPWEYDRFRRLAVDVERIFTVRQLQETLERDLGIPVESLKEDDYVPALRDWMPFTYPRERLRALEREGLIPLRPPGGPRGGPGGQPILPNEEDQGSGSGQLKRHSPGGGEGSLASTPRPLPPSPGPVTQPHAAALGAALAPARAYRRVPTVIGDPTAPTHPDSARLLGYPPRVSNCHICHKSSVVLVMCPSLPANWECQVRVTAPEFRHRFCMGCLSRHTGFEFHAVRTGLVDYKCIVCAGECPCASCKRAAVDSIPPSALGASSSGGGEDGSGSGGGGGGGGAAAATAHKTPLTGHAPAVMAPLVPAPLMSSMAAGAFAAPLLQGAGLMPYPLLAAAAALPYATGLLTSPAAYGFAPSASRAVQQRGGGGGSSSGGGSSAPSLARSSSSGSVIGVSGGGGGGNAGSSGGGADGGYHDQPGEVQALCELISKANGVPMPLTEGAPFTLVAAVRAAARAAGASSKSGARAALTEGGTVESWVHKYCLGLGPYLRMLGLAGGASAPVISVSSASGSDLGGVPYACEFKEADLMPLVIGTAGLDAVAAASAISSADAGASERTLSIGQRRKCLLCDANESRTSSRRRVVGIHSLVPINYKGDPVFCCERCNDLILSRRSAASSCTPCKVPDPDDGYEDLCALCGQTAAALRASAPPGSSLGASGPLTVCSAQCCPRAYCKDCLNLLLDARGRALLQLPEWLCPPCYRAELPTLSSAGMIAFGVMRPRVSGAGGGGSAGKQGKGVGAQSVSKYETTQSNEGTASQSGQPRVAPGLSTTGSAPPHQPSGSAAAGGGSSSGSSSSSSSSSSGRGSERSSSSAHEAQLTQPAADDRVGNSQAGDKGRGKRANAAPAPSLSSSEPASLPAAEADTHKQQVQREGGSSSSTKRRKLNDGSAEVPAAAAGAAAAAPEAAEAPAPALPPHVSHEVFEAALPFFAHYAKQVRLRSSAHSTCADTDNECFVCKDGGELLECDCHADDPLEVYLAQSRARNRRAALRHTLAGTKRRRGVHCSKVYHLECLGEAGPRPNAPKDEEWVCPRHVCQECGSRARVVCRYCPTAFCLRHACAPDCGRDCLTLLDPAARAADMDADAHLMVCPSCVVYRDEAERRGLLSADPAEARALPWWRYEAETGVLRGEGSTAATRTKLLQEAVTSSRSTATRPVSTQAAAAGVKASVPAPAPPVSPPATTVQQLPPALLAHQLLSYPNEGQAQLQAAIAVSQSVSLSVPAVSLLTDAGVGNLQALLALRAPFPPVEQLPPWEPPRRTP